MNRDRGFTLIETLVVVVTISVIAVAIATVFTVVARSSPSTEARADDARSLLGVTTWLPNDVSATPMVPLAAADPYWDKEPATPSGCAGTDPSGINLVRLIWSENFGGNTTYRSSFRLVDDGDSSYISRVYCANGGTPTISKLTSDLPPIGDVAWTLEWKTQLRGGVDYLVGLVFELEGLGSDANGATLRVDATSQNLNETLPAPTPPPDYVPLPQPPTPPTPNTAPTAIDVSGLFQIGTPIVVLLNVDDDHDDPDALQPTLTMPDATWSYTVDPVDSRSVTIVPPATVVPGPYPIPYTATDSGYPDTGPLTSASAVINLTLQADPVPVPQPPAITPISPDPTFQRNASVSFTVDATDPDGDDAALAVTLSLTDPMFTGWSYHIDPTDNLNVIIDGGPFNAGTFPITYRVTDETGLWAESTVTITLTPIPCAASFDATNPTTAARKNNGNGGEPLKDPVPIKITRSGDCVLGLQYTPMTTQFTGSYGSTATSFSLPATNLELWQKNKSTVLNLVRLDPGPFTTSTWSITTP